VKVVYNTVWAKWRVT